MTDKAEDEGKRHVETPLKLGAKPSRERLRQFARLGLNTSIWLSGAFLPMGVSAAPILYSSQSAFLADLGGATPTTYNFEVGSGFPAAGGTIGVVGGVNFSAQTEIYPTPPSGTQAMTGAGGTFTTATVDFQNLATRPNAVGMFGLDLTQFGPEVIRVSATFTSGATSSFDIRLAPSAPDFTPTFLGFIDRNDTVRSLSMFGTEVAGPPPSRAWLIDDLVQAYVPPALLAPEQVVAVRTGSNGVSWTSKYDLSFANGQVKVGVDIQLVDMNGNPLAAPPMLPAPRLNNSDGCGLLLTCIWEKGIEGIWSNRFNVVDQNLTYPLLFDVNFVSSGQDFNTKVNPATPCSSRMSAWCLDNPGGWGNEYQDEVAAHEFGHMLGLYDEYFGGTVDPTVPVSSLCTSGGQAFCNSLMADFGPTLDRYYESILANLELGLGRNLSLAFAGQPPYPADPPRFDLAQGEDPPGQVSQPATLILVLAGVLAGLGYRVRVRRRPGSTP
jgi:hypothetical protein